MNAFNPRMPGRKSPARFLSPWLMVGVAIILGLAVTVLAMRNTQREKRHMSQNLMDRAAALIWAMEAGTRTWMGLSGGGQHLQVLLQETAKQPGIAYMAVTDAKGTVLAHSDSSKIGHGLHDPNTIPSPIVSTTQKWRQIETPEGKVFEVYKLFSPQPGFHYEMWRGQPEACTDCAPSAPPKRPTLAAPTNGEDIPVVFVGLSGKPFEEALAEDFRNTIIVALLVGFLGLGGFVSLFWAQNYRLSRRMLQDTWAFASEVVTNLPVGLLTCDPEGRITLANEAALEMFDAVTQELEGTPIQGRGGVDWNAAIQPLSQGKPVLEKEYELRSFSGRLTPVSLSASRIVNEEGVFLGHLFILRNLEEVKHLQDQIQRNERLTALGNLAAGVAHEIRNPLSSIKGFAVFLAGKIKGEGPDKEAAKVMIREVDRLNRVVSELLEFAKPGDMKLREQDVNQIIVHSLRLAESDARAKDVAVHFEPDRSLPPLSLDAERFTQALLNLFLNAIQATAAGGALEVSASPAKTPGRLAVRISDTGKGMAPEVLAGIFNPYYTTKPSGTGLGLAIVHRIVEGHGGEIKVDSQPGKGTTFTILLPLQAAS